MTDILPLWMKLSCIYDDPYAFFKKEEIGYVCNLGLRLIRLIFLDWKLMAFV